MSFDPYRKWLGIPDNRRPPNYYELLGITPGENDPDVIRSAIDQRRMYILSKKGEGQDGHVKVIFGLIEEATSTLLVPEFKHGYDRQLGLHLKKKGSRRSYVLPSWMESRVVRIYGEGSGIVGDLFGIVAILLGAFGLMAWWSFRLQDRTTDETQVQTSEPMALAQAAEQVGPKIADKPAPAPVEPPTDNFEDRGNLDNFDTKKVTVELEKKNSTGKIAALKGTYLIQWEEENGKAGDLEYEILPNLSVVRAGITAGKLSNRNGEIWLDFDEKMRGSVQLTDITDDSFLGFHTWEDGKQSTWKAKRKSGLRDTNASNAQPPTSSSATKSKLLSQESLMDSLQGQWKCIGTEEIGKVLDEATVTSQNRRIDIKGNNLRMTRLKDGSRATYVGKFEVDSSNQNFDFVGKVQDGDGKLIEWVGICDLDADTLRLCYRYKNNDQLVRPTVFETDISKPNISVFYTYERVVASAGEAKTQGITSTFDGKSLKGWHSDSKQWQVKKGVLTGEKLDPKESGSFLVSDKTYQDFELYAEFRLIEGNSGIQIRSVEKETGMVLGPQADIAFHDNFRFLGCLTGEGIQPGMIAKTSEETRIQVAQSVNPKGWNAMKVSVQGTQVSITINDVNTVQATLPNGYERGVVALQLHGAGRTRIEFRKIEIVEK